MGKRGLHMYCTHTHTHTHTHTAMRVDLNLQDQCVELLASWLNSKQDAKELPLPLRLIERLEQSIDK